MKGEVVPTSHLSVEQRTEVIKLYTRGVKTDEITQITGIKRPTIYWILDQAKIKPSRINRGELARLEKEVIRLKAELEHERAVTAALIALQKQAGGG